MNRTLLLLVACLPFSGCTTHDSKRSAAGLEALQRLHTSFVTADSMERAPRMDTLAWKQLGANLRSQMHTLGDASFAEALSKESDDVRVSVVNCMGCDPPDYRDYPKTGYVLSSAPKI